MGWQKVVLSRTEIEKQQALARLEETFLQAFMKAADTSEMALLSDDDYHQDSISIYFSPVCSPSCDALIAEYSGKECPAPPREGVFVLAGDEDVLDLLS